MKNKVITLLLTCFISVLFGACGQTQKREQVLHRVMQNFVTLDPQTDLNVEVGFIAMHVFSRLVEIERNGILRPSLLKELPGVSQDGLTYSFELNRNIKFSNGVELKSSDVKFTFERMLWPETKGESRWVVDTIKGAKNVQDGRTKELTGFKIIDDYRFDIRLEKPYAQFIQGLTTPYASIFPEKACTESGNLWASSIVGSGSFIVLKWEKDRELVLGRNENYFGTKPYLDKIVSKISEKDSADFAEDQAEYDLGKLDTISVPADKYAEYRTNPKYKNDLEVIQTLNIRYLTLNNKNPILKNPRVRQAISIAIDRPKLCNIILKEAAVPAYTMIPKGIDGFDGSARIEYNVDKAKLLLKEAGYPNGFTIDYAQVSKSIVDADYAIQSMLGQVGIKLNMIPVDENGLKKLRQEGKFTICLSNWWADIPDADNFLYNLFYSKLGRSNNYNSTIFDSLCDEARGTLDKEKRKEIYRRLDRLICREDWATVPLFRNIEVVLTKPNVKGVYINPITDLPIFGEAYKQ